MAGAGQFLSRGLIIGVVGAVIWSRYASDSSAPGSGASSSSSAPPIWTPSGIKARARDLATEIAQKQAPSVGVTEAELMGVPSASSSGSGSAWPSGGATASASGSARAGAPPPRHVYQADAATLSRMLAEHAREPSVLPWAAQQETSLRTTFATSSAEPPDVLAVECRKKTCAVRITFPTAAQRDDYLSHDQLPLPTGCHGVTALPRDLPSSSPYELRVIYLCR
jgi:hypothetical protein